MHGATGRKTIEHVPTTRLAVSNIAWLRSDEWVVGDALAAAGASGVEIAPPRVWDSPGAVSDADAADHRALWAQRGLPIVALQSLLFGRPDLLVFTSAERQAETVRYLGEMIRLASNLGAHALVFGSPRNRQVGTLRRDEAMATAVPFFRSLGEAAAASGVWFCLEPNPAVYDCDFLRTTDECVDFLEMVGHPGLGIHLDAAAITLNAENPHAAVRRAAPWLRHFHVSEPYLAAIGAGGVQHEVLADALGSIDYPHWVSIEMRWQEGSSVAGVLDAVEKAARWYAPLWADDRARATASTKAHPTGDTSGAEPRP